MSTWTTAQWGAFTGTTIALLAALGLLIIALRTIRGWTRPATFLAEGPPRTPRPSLMLAERREIAARHAPGWAIMAGYIEPPVERTRPLPFIGGPDGTWRDPALDDFTEHGIGALPSIQIMTVDPTLRTSTEIEAEESAWVNAYADLSAAMPETAAAAETMRANLEPALRKARLWLIRAGETGARATLAQWRISEDTGEIRNPFAITPRSVAHTLLIS